MEKESTRLKRLGHSAEPHRLLRRSAHGFEVALDGAVAGDVARCRMERHTRPGHATTR